MRVPVVSAAAVCGIVAVVLVAAPGVARDREDGTVLRAEAARLRAHFDSTIAELEARDVSGLSPSPKRWADPSQGDCARFFEI